MQCRLLVWLAQQAQYIHSQNIVIQAVFETEEGGNPTRVKGTIAGDVAQHGVGAQRQLSPRQVLDGGPCLLLELAEGIIGYVLG